MTRIYQTLLLTLLFTLNLASQAEYYSRSQTIRVDYNEVQARSINEDVSANINGTDVKITTDFIVSWKCNEEQQKKILSKYICTVTKEASYYTVINFFDVGSGFEFLKEAHDKDLIDWGQPDIIAPIRFETDPYFDTQHQIYDSTIYPFSVNMDTVWNITKGAGVKVAIIDNGLEDHDDLGTIDTTYNPFTGGTGEPLGPDTIGGSIYASSHGLSVAGIVNMQHNGIGGRGIAPEASLIGVNIFSDGISSAQIATGIDFAVNQGADVLVNSWGYIGSGGGNQCSVNFPLIEAAIDNASTNGRNGKGSVVVFASGNWSKTGTLGGTDECVTQPGSVENALAVGAINYQTGKRTSYSSYGIALDVMAPSNDQILNDRGKVTDNIGGVFTCSDAPNSYITGFGGTSAACPVVGGLAALLIAADTMLTGARVKDIIRASARDLGKIGFDTETGYGLVDFEIAFENLDNQLTLLELCIDTTDADNDGICATLDCDDSDLNAPYPCGSACDDGDSTTYNDVYLMDGCTCLGIACAEICETTSEKLFLTSDCADTLSWSVSDGSFNLIGSTATWTPPGSPDENYIITSTCKDSCYSTNENEVIIILTIDTGGTIISDQIICTSGDPDQISGIYLDENNVNYQWQSSIVDSFSGYSDIGGATSGSYDPTTISQTTWYRRMAHNACLDTSYSNVIEILVASPPTALISGNTSSCTTDSTTLTASGGTEYLWSTAETTAAVNVLPGTYTVTVTDANGCTATDDHTITDSGPCCTNVTVAGTLSGNQAICGGYDPTTITGTVASGGVGGSIEYRWYTNGGLNGGTGQNYDPPNISSTTTYYREARRDCQASWISSNTITKTVYGFPTANAGGDQTVGCASYSANLSASGGVSYLWNNGGTLSSTTISNPVATPSVTTDYTVTVTDGNGCTDTDVVRVNVRTNTSANAGADTDHCTGGSSNLSASGGVTYAWSPSTGLSATNISNPVASHTSTLVYTVTVTDANSCTDTDQITVTVNSATANAGSDDEVCTDELVQLNGSGGVTYAWESNNGQPDPASVAGPYVGPNVTTTYTLTVTDANGCTDTDQVTITANPIPTPTIDDTSICDDDDVGWSWTATTGNYDVTTKIGAGTPVNHPSQAGTTIDIAELGTFTYRITVTDANGCDDTESDAVTVTNPLLIVTETTAPPTFNDLGSAWSFTWDATTMNRNACCLDVIDFSFETFRKGVSVDTHSGTTTSGSYQAFESIACATSSPVAGDELRVTGTISSDCEATVYSYDITYTMTSGDVTTCGCP